MDPHIRAYRDRDLADQLNGDFPDGGNPQPGFGEDMGNSLRTARLYQKLEEKGDFATLDKAKHNEHFREFLLTNFEETDFGHDF